MIKDTVVVMFKLRKDDLALVKTLDSKWNIFKKLRDSKEFITGSEPGHISVLEREGMIQTLLDIFDRIVWN